MGHVSVVVISHDALDEIKKDPNFGANLVHAIHENYRTLTRTSCSTLHGTAGWVILQQHGDQPLEVHTHTKVHKIS